MINTFQYVFCNFDWKTRLKLFQTKPIYELVSSYGFQFRYTKYAFPFLPSLYLQGRLEEYDITIDHVYNLDRNDMRFCLTSERPRLDNKQRQFFFDFLNNKNALFTEQDGVIEYDYSFPIDKLEQLEARTILNEIKELIATLNKFEVKNKHNSRYGSRAIQR